MVDVLDLDREVRDGFLVSLLEDSLTLLDSTVDKSLSNFFKNIYTSLFKSLSNSDLDYILSFSNFTLLSVKPVLEDLLV